MTDRRIIQNNIPLDFTCENNGFKTDITKGYEHIPGAPRGSVTPEELDTHLFLEYVIDKKNGNSCFWFIWYDLNGIPKTPDSAVFYEDDIKGAYEYLPSIAKAK